jgi:hypothetical protein
VCARERRLAVVGLGGVGPNFDRARKFSRRTLGEGIDRTDGSSGSTVSAPIERRPVMVVDPFDRVTESFGNRVDPITPEARAFLLGESRPTHSNTSALPPRFSAIETARVAVSPRSS